MPNTYGTNLKRNARGQLLPYTVEERLESVERKKKNCLQCDKVFVSPAKRQRFCCRSCSARFNNLNGTSGRHHRHDVTCRRCGVKCKQRKQTFCSRNCKALFQVENWLKGDNPSVGYGKVPDLIRQFLLDEAEGKCSQCRWAEVNVTTGKVPLEIHHVDGNSSNNLRENLQVLCPNCHSLTPTFRNRKNNGRTRWKPHNG